MYDPMAEYFMPNMVEHNYDTVNGSVDGNTELFSVLIDGIKSQGRGSTKGYE